MTKLEEIKQQALAMKHWFEVRPDIQIHAYSETPYPDMLWLCEQLEKAIEMAEYYYEEYKDGKADNGGKAYDFLEGLEK